MKKRYQRRGVKGQRKKHVGAISLQLEEMQHPLADIPEEKWDDVRKQIGSEIASEHKRLLGELDKLIKECNPLQTLAHFAFFDRFLHEIQTGKYYKPLLQHSVEFLQAYYLTVPVAELNGREAEPSALLKLNEVLRGLESTFPMLGVERPRNERKDAQTRASLSQQVRIHTYGVRNAGYYQQVMEQLRGVFERLDADFEKFRGLKLSALVTMCERILIVIQTRLQEQARVMFLASRKKSVSEAVNAYCDAAKIPQNVRGEMLDVCRVEGLTLEQARTMCANHAGLSLPKAYLLKLSDFIDAYPEPVNSHHILEVLVNWSMRPEGLVGHNRDHIFLNNPIWSKPIVQVGPDEFFWPLIELFHSFGLEMLEQLIRPNSQMWDRYQSRVRADFLEQRVYDMCLSEFPDGLVFKGSMWHNAQGEVEGENDVLVVVDAVALAIECKSGRITPEARRGSPDRLRKEVKKLIEDAAKQSQRFAKLLLDSKDTLELPTKRGVVNKINAARIKKVIRLNITLDYFGPLACAVRELLDANLIDPSVATAPTIALVDFENVLHILESQIERLHYFSRRADVERNISLLANEEDLLASYLAIGLNFGQLEEEFTGRLNLGYMQNNIQPYLMAYHSGRSATKPRRNFTNWWTQILQRLQSAKFPGSILAGFVFLDVRREDQARFEKSLRRLIKEVKLRWHDPNHLNKVLGVNGPSKRKTAICAVVLKYATRDLRDDAVGQAFACAVETAKTDDVVVLCFKAEAPTWPYGALCVYDPELQEPKGTTSSM